MKRVEGPARGDEYVFPAVSRATPDGLLAVGGDLCTGRLLAAYRSGIFPWYSEGEPILWWSPDPRVVLFPDEFKLSEREWRRLESAGFLVTSDRAFGAVMRNCARVPRCGQAGTWITRAMVDAYEALHKAGYAHSIEVWAGRRLVGGLYGVSIGSCFFGESMFSLVSDGGRAAIGALSRTLARAGYLVIDCQVQTDHVIAWGARAIGRREFVGIVRRGVGTRPCFSPWGREFRLIPS